MIDDSCHVIISCYVIMFVLKILVICFIPYELEFSVFFFLFRFFGWVAVLQQKGGRANTVSTHATPTPINLLSTTEAEARQSLDEIAIRFGLDYH